MTCPSENGHRDRQAPVVRDGFLGFLRYGGICIRVVWKVASPSLPGDAEIDATRVAMHHPTGYPWQGCASAEPASVSPDVDILLHFDLAVNGLTLRSNH